MENRYCSLSLKTRNPSFLWNIVTRKFNGIEREEERARVVFRFWKSSLCVQTCATLIKILKFYSSSSTKYRARQVNLKLNSDSIAIFNLIVWMRFSSRCSTRRRRLVSFARFPSLAALIARCSAIFLDNNYPGKGIHRNWIFFTRINPSFLGFIESRGPLVLPLVRGGQFKAALKRLACVWQRERERESQPTFALFPLPPSPSPRSLLLSVIRKSHRLFTL